MQMATPGKPAVGKPGLEEEAPQVHRIRITLTSKHVKNLEKGAPPQLDAAGGTCCRRISLGKRGRALSLAQCFMLQLWRYAESLAMAGSFCVWV